MELFILVCKRFKRNPAQIFKCAYDYFEMRVSPKKMEKKFYSCCVVDARGKVFVVRVPKFVEKFCFAVLIKYITLPTKKEMLAMNG